MAKSRAELELLDKAELMALRIDYRESIGEIERGLLAGTEAGWDTARIRGALSHYRTSLALIKDILAYRGQIANTEAVGALWRAVRDHLDQETDETFAALAEAFEAIPTPARERVE